jgi:hypothetical protein
MYCSMCIYILLGTYLDFNDALQRSDLDELNSWPLFVGGAGAQD